ncbi:MAG: hypothetical protein HUJ31_17640 [Pseudomonadales bacterium]|nr:hypothetical protein [Pseudomonadales bacterium]
MSKFKKRRIHDTLLVHAIPLNLDSSRFLIGLTAALLLAILAVPSQAEDAGYSEEGTTACLECHDETEDYPVLSIFHTAHGVIGDDNSPLGDLGCESCHGPNAEPVDRPRSEPTISFGP